MHFSLQLNFLSLTRFASLIWYNRRYRCFSATASFVLQPSYSLKFLFCHVLLGDMSWQMAKLSFKSFFFVGRPTFYPRSGLLLGTSQWSCLDIRPFWGADWSLRGTFQKWFVKMGSWKSLFLGVLSLRLWWNLVLHPEGGRRWNACIGRFLLAWSWCQG